MKVEVQLLRWTLLVWVGTVLPFFLEVFGGYRMIIVQKFSILLRCSSSGLLDRDSKFYLQPFFPDLFGNYVLLAASAPSLRYMRQKENSGNLPFVIWALKFLASLSSLQLLESFYVCFIYNVQCF